MTILSCLLLTLLPDGYTINGHFIISTLDIAAVYLLATNILPRSSTFPRANARFAVPKAYCCIVEAFSCYPQFHCIATEHVKQ